jgi:hypothetical protein
MDILACRNSLALPPLPRTRAREWNGITLQLGKAIRGRPLGKGKPLAFDVFLGIKMGRFEVSDWLGTNLGIAQSSSRNLLLYQWLDWNRWRRECRSDFASVR